MKASFSSHISEELLEQYAFRRLTEQESAPVEEHLLICPTCQDRLKEVDDYIQVMKLAASQQPRKSRFSNLAGRPLQARLGIATLIVIAVALVIPWRGRNMPAREVTLVASRGSSSTPVAEARAGAGLILRMDVSEIAKSENYAVSLVNSEGRELWRTLAPANQHQLLVQSPAKLTAGRYWVRLFDTSQPPVLLREYGLELK